MRNILDKKVGLGRNVDDWDYRKYENSMEIVSKLQFENTDSNRLYQYIPENELMELQKKGFEDNHSDLIEVNESLRDYNKILQSGVNGFIKAVGHKVKSMNADPEILNMIVDERDKMTEVLQQRLY